jgi:tRNA G18 (ribose-2'-O)-methylase SpoU
LKGRKDPGEESTEGSFEKIREEAPMSQHRRKPSKKQDNPGQVAVSGMHPVRVVLKQDRVSEVWIRDGANEHRVKDVVMTAKSQGVRVVEVAARDFDEASLQ